uniref:30S ribosomal protein S10, chloroplastic n=2 Tax=Gelidium TaxID=2811 RepID=A0A411FT90_9FLOR|nr:ribosomal protein S10 [Gelidium coulteri]YP_009565349.1 ribosomal protein S10 [Gelidium sinicola]QBA96300.1 ribosomal protein S10 [Gelidium coulteri]QBA96700.1 ribosomal protein S10 [Gelidium sinicola]
MSIENKIRIKLKAYNYNILNESCQEIIQTASRTQAKTIGPIPMPTKRRIYCILRSPHVDKDSREHFEIRTHTKIIDICEPSSQTIDLLMKLNIHAGVDIEVKL